MSISDLLLNATIAHCRAVLREGTVLLQSGDAVTLTPAGAWAEFWIDRVSTPIARRTAPATLELGLTINCFGRPPVTATAPAELATTIQKHLSGVTIPFAPEAPTGCWIRLQEADCRDVSRPATAKSTGLWHWVVTIRGTARIAT